MNKCKVLHVGEIVSGGVATYISTLLSIDKDIDNYLILSYNHSFHDWKIDNNRIKYYPYERNIIGVIKALYYINNYINEIKPDIIYCHSTWAGVMTRLHFLLFRKKYKIIYNSHGWSFLRDTPLI